MTDGALEQLKGWGHFTVVDDADSADIVLRFDKKTDRERQNSESTDEKGTTTWSGSMTFSSQVHMRAYLKGTNSPFYTTQTSESKKKAGVSCVTSVSRRRPALDRAAVAQMRMGISTYRERYSASGSSGRIWPALCESLNSSRTSPSLPSAFRKSMM